MPRPSDRPDSGKFPKTPPFVSAPLKNPKPKPKPKPSGFAGSVSAGNALKPYLPPKPANRPASGGGSSKPKPKPAATTKPKPAVKPKPAAKPTKGSKPSTRPASSGGSSGGSSRPSSGGTRGGSSTGTFGTKPAKAPAKKPKTKATKPKTGGGGGGGAATTPPVDPALKFVMDEIQRQIAQDASLTQFVDTNTGTISQQMTDQANAAAAIAGQYNPVTLPMNATLDANAQAKIAQDVGLTNQVGADQQGALASLIAKQGSAGADLMGNMRGALQTQHRDYSRQLEGMQPALVEQKRNEDLARQQAIEAHAMQLRTQAMQNQLAKQQFGLQVADFNAGQAQQEFANGMAIAESTKAAAPNPKDQSKYGFGIHAKYDKDLDGLYGMVAAKQVPEMGPDGKPTGRMVANPNRRWRDVITKLTGLGVPGGRAVLLASKWLPDRLKIHGKASPAVIYNILRSGELGFKVNDAVAQQVLANIGPNAWEQRRPSAKGTASGLLGGAAGMF